ncbi:MAG: leucine-rich repeat domain-containing protein [Candidatus Buchananbacteria bacterium]
MKKTIFVAMLLTLLLNGCTLWQESSVSQKPTVSSTNQTASNNKLDLSNQQLTKVPEYVFNRINLEELDLSNNLLTGAIQSQIGNLKNLKVLKANNNQMTGVPAEVGQLSKLQILDLSNNQLTGLPNEMGNLKNLQTLNISGNNYSVHDFDVIMKGLPANVKVIK